MKISALNLANAQNNTCKGTNKTNFKGAVLNQAFRECTNPPSNFKAFNEMLFKLLKAVKAEPNLKILEPKYFKELILEDKNADYDRIGVLTCNNSIYNTPYDSIIIAKDGQKPILVYSRDKKFPMGETKYRGRYIEFLGEGNDFKRFGYYCEKGSEITKYSHYFQMPMLYSDYWTSGTHTGRMRTLEVSGYDTKHYNPDGSIELFGGIKSLFRDLFG